MLTTQQIRQAIKRNKWLLILPAILLGFLAYFTQNVLPGDYEAETVLIVTSNDDEPITYNKLVLNEKLANVYSEFLESEDLFQAVAEKINPDWEASEVSNNFDYDVNPQAGVISLSYKDSNEDRAGDTLTMLAEEFRSYARNYLRMENIEYLQNVVVDQSSKVRVLIFAVLGFLVGGLLGILFTILKEILSDKIQSADDIRELGYELLADFTNESQVELAKLKKKIKMNGPNAVIGLSRLGTKKMGENILGDLADLLIAASLSVGDQIDITKKLKELKVDYPYVLIDERDLSSPLAIELSDYEDYKIILVEKNTRKGDLVRELNELERLGIRVLGVVYYS